MIGGVFEDDQGQLWTKPPWTASTPRRLTEAEEAVYKRHNPDQYAAEPVDWRVKRPWCYSERCRSCKWSAWIFSAIQLETKFAEYCPQCHLGYLVRRVVLKPQES